MTENKEVWKPVLGYEGIYEFSNKQRVRSVDRVINYKNGTKHRLGGKMLTITPTGDGYLCVNLSKNGNSKTTYIHQLAWEYFNGVKVPDGFDVGHRDSNRQNNDPSNLEVVTHKANCNTVDTQGKTPAEKRWDNPAWVAHIKRLAQMKPTKQVTAINLDTNEQIIYNSVNDAQDATGVARSTISKIGQNKQYQSNGYVFLYRGVNNLIYHAVACNKEVQPESTNMKHVDWTAETTADYFADITGKEA